MIPKGTGWQHLRALALASIPQGTNVYYKRALPLHEWWRSGSFRVEICDRREIRIDTAGAEIGSALLADVEYLLDHAAEHRAMIHMGLTSWNSPAWSVVTAYYWTFFSGLALTRLVGRSVSFLTRNDLAELRQLAGSLHQPGAGALKLEVGAYKSATNRDLQLKPTKSQLHDAVWNSIHALISEVFGRCNKSSDPEEFRLWSALKFPAGKLGPSWPSDVRNAVNYRLGAGYREVTRRSEIDMMRQIQLRTPSKPMSLIDDLETAGFAVSPPANRSLRNLTLLLGWYAILIAAIAETLHAEVLYRQTGDDRWNKLRAEFLRKRCLVGTDDFWPFLG